MFRKNTASQFICIQGVDASTGGIKSGVTWTVRRCIDGTFAAGGGTVTEDGTTGWYKYAMSQADTNGNDISFNFTGSGAVPQTVNIVTTAGDPTDSVRFGLTALPNATAGANTGLPVVGTQVPNATAGASGGLVINGSNSGTLTLAALTVTGAVTFSSTFGVSGLTTLTGLTTGALSCTTITASGAVAFQSTFAVTTSTSLAALSCTTLTASGAVAFQSTFAVTTSTSLAALSCTTLTASGAVAFQSTFGVTGTTSLAAVTTSGTVTFNAFTVTNSLTVSGATTLTGAVTASNASNNIVGIDVAKLAGTAYGSSTLFTLASHDPGATLGTSTLTQTQVTGGAYALNSASFAFNAALDFTTTMKTSLNAATPAVTVSDKTGFSLTSSYDFAKGTAAMTESYNADGAAPTPAQALFVIMQGLTEFAISSTTKTVKKLDGSTTAYTETLDSATAPTSITRTT